MSGHSKWHNIRVKKTAQDRKRGKIYTRHAKLIEIAVREGGGGDPDANPRLATAVENAKMDNVPNENISRAIKKGTGELKGEQTEEVFYAGYGPGNVALLIECLTDNRNRTIASVKTIITKHGGRWAELSSVQWMFDRKGMVVARKDGGFTKKDDLELALIDDGAENISWSDDGVIVTTGAALWSKIRGILLEQGATIESAGLRFMPNQTTTVADIETARKLMDIIELIDEDDDVSEVHINAEIPDAVATQLG